MSNISHRAEHYRDMADECRQLATFSVSSKLKSRFSRMADRYGTLAEAEEQDVPYDGSNITVGPSTVIMRSAREKPSRRSVWTPQL
jgi:hypothetical protein